MNKDLLLSLVGKMVKVDRGGPESRIGKLLGVENDHFALLTEQDGVIYYLTHHIKSLTENSRKGIHFKEGEITEEATCLTAKDFATLLDGLKYRWVKINRGGKESIEGVLDDINEDYVTVISNEEVIRISMFHIRNIGYEIKKKKSNDEDENNKEGGKKDEKSK
ncbi:hypothetical protein [Bacillus massiliigorillae]|uniref:hypothetical protein n=1 Tax=Bacillus massiliigorillae TaxID=1243664 RepID=UPI00039D211F|nr:hypothetical protein [Bacillus massiliigorillae]